MESCTGMPVLFPHEWYEAEQKVRRMLVKFFKLLGTVLVGSTVGIKKRHIVAISGSAVAVLSGLAAYLSMNTQFDLIMPDNARLDNVVLSSDNYTRLKHNVGVFTVYQPRITGGNATSGYCPIAEFIHEHEDGYNDTPVGNTTIYNATAPPPWCGPELNPLPVPEFPPLPHILQGISDLLHAAGSGRLTV